MTNFPVDVLGAIKSMLIRSIGNPNAFVYTIKMLLDSYRFIMFFIFIGVVIRFLLRFDYKILKKIKENKKDKNNFIKFLYEHLKNYKEYGKNKKKFIEKKDVKEILSEEKYTFKLLKYPIIGSILVGTSWLQVSILYWLFAEFYETQGDVIRETLPIQESRVLGMWATYSLGIFIIAGCSIGLSFGNKMIRNLGILIYVLGIFFIFFGNFLNNGVIINDLPNFVM